MTVTVSVRGVQLPEVQEVKITREMNSAESVNITAPVNMRPAWPITVNADGRTVFDGYITRVDVDYMSNRVTAQGISSPILNKIMQVKITVPENVTVSWANYMALLLKECGATLSYTSSLPTVTYEKGVEKIEEGIIYRDSSSDGGTDAGAGGRGFLSGGTKYTLPSYNSTGNATSNPNSVTLTQGLLAGGTGSRQVSQSTSTGTVEVKTVEVGFSDILKNMEKETGRKLFYTVKGKTVYIGVQGSGYYKIRDEYTSELKISEDVSQVVDSLEGVEVHYG